MAQYTVQHSCGHEQTHALFGPGKDRDRKRDWLGTTLCRDCFRAKKDAEPPEVVVRPVADPLPDSPGNAVEIVVLNSFGVKDVLKEHGYRFGRFALPSGHGGLVRMLMDEGRPGWSLIVGDDMGGHSEIDWICAQGWPVRVIDGPAGRLAGYFSAVAEGRPDVAGIRTEANR